MALTLRAESLQDVLNFSTVPGVKIREVREFMGLEPTGDDEVDDTILGLPMALDDSNE